MQGDAKTNLDALRALGVDVTFVTDDACLAELAGVLRDATLAVAVNDRDRVVDDFYNSIFRTLVTYMVEYPPSISDAAHLLFVAKNLERVGDHATNVAEMVYFAATGEYMAERERTDAYEQTGS